MKLLPLVLLLVCAVISSCTKQGAAGATGKYNHFSCGNDTAVPGPYLLAEIEEPEDSLARFYQVLNAKFGTPYVTFLHFRLEDYREFFAPEQRKIDTELLASPLGIQKILIWDSVVTGSGETVQISLQVRPVRKGSRTIDKRVNTLELRVRHVNDSSAVDLCTSEAAEVNVFREALAEALGAPHDGRPDPGFATLEAEYERRRSKYCDRVWPILSGGCYPPFSRIEEMNVMRLQVCENESMTDTLSASVVVLDSGGLELPFLMTNDMTDSLTSRIRVFNGPLGYSIWVDELQKIAQIWFIFDNGVSLLFFEKGDFIRDALPFKPRKSPEIFGKPDREEKKRNQEQPRTT